MNATENNIKDFIKHRLDSMSTVEKLCMRHCVSIYASTSSKDLVLFDCKNPIDCHDRLMKVYKGQLFFITFISMPTSTDAVQYKRRFSKDVTQKLADTLWSEAYRLHPELKEIIEPSVEVDDIP